MKHIAGWVVPENYLPVCVPAGQSAAAALHQALLRESFAPILPDKLVHPPLWGIGLDEQRQRLSLLGLGRYWRLPGVGLFRLIRPLLLAHAWQGWEIADASAGLFSLSDARDPDAVYVDVGELHVRHPASSYFPVVRKSSYTEFEPFWIHLQQGGRVLHYLFESSGVNHQIQAFLNRGVGLLDELEAYFPTGLPHEAEVGGCVYLDCEYKTVTVWSSDFPHSICAARNRDTQILSLWPGWQFHVSADYLSIHQRLGACPADQLSPRFLQAWLRAEAETPVVVPDPSSTQEPLMLNQWGRALLDPVQGEAFVREWSRLLDVPHSPDIPERLLWGQAKFFADDTGEQMPDPYLAHLPERALHFFALFYADSSLYSGRVGVRRYLKECSTFPDGLLLTLQWLDEGLWQFSDWPAYLPSSAQALRHIQNLLRLLIPQLTCYAEIKLLKEIFERTPVLQQSVAFPRLQGIDGLLAQAWVAPAFALPTKVQAHCSAAFSRFSALEQVLFLEWVCHGGSVDQADGLASLLNQLQPSVATQWELLRYRKKLK
ncbi:MAG: hypothetical protein ACO1RX_18540 [Candidatus Sericytochromatia bacterium]